MNLVGSALGWLIIVSLFLTLMNYPIKKINRAASRLPTTDTRRRLAARLTRFLTSNHRFLALITLFVLIAHFIIQSIYRWVSLSGLIAAVLVIATGLLGGFGQFVRHKKRGAWFYIHRTLAALLAIAVIVHVALLGLPVLSWPSQQPGETTLTGETTAETSGERVFTLDELAGYDGKDGKPAYVAVDGIVYDVTALSRWLGGFHMNLHNAGQDLSDDILQAPHSKAMLQRAKIVGKLAPAK